jgi:hypothetical protein
VLNGIYHITTLTDRFGDHRVLGGMSLVRAELSPEGDIIRPEGSGLGCEAIQTALGALVVGSDADIVLLDPH